LRGDLDAVVMKTLRKEPQHRYASVDALQDDIVRQRDGLPVRSRRGTAVYRALARALTAVGRREETDAPLRGRGSER
jgi:serine/threonine-protein kinase